MQLDKGDITNSECKINILPGDMQISEHTKMLDKQVLIHH